MTEESRVEVEKKSKVEYVYCPICRDIVKSQGRHAHFSNIHPKEDYDEYNDKFEEAPAPKETPKGERRGYEVPTTRWLMRWLRSFTVAAQIVVCWLSSAAPLRFSTVTSSSILYYILPRTVPNF